MQAGAVESLARLAEAAAGLREDLRRLARAALEKARVPGPDGAVDVSVGVLGDLPDSVILEVLHLALESLAPASSSSRGEEGIHIPGSLFRTVLGWIRPGGPKEARASFGKRAGLTHSLELRYGLIRIRHEDGRGAAPEEAAEEIPLRLDETVEWARWRLVAQEAAAPEAPGWLEERVDAESIASAGLLRVRSRREGDRIWPLGAPGTKSLKEFFRERRVRPSERGRIPLIVAGETIVWVVGHRIDHRFRLRPETTRALVLRALAPG